MTYRLFFLLSLFYYSTLCLADELTLKWSAPQLREDGEPITGTLNYQVTQNGAIVYTGTDTTFTATINRGSPHWFSVISLENGLRSNPIYKRIYIEQSPPNPPAWQDPPGSF